MCQVCSAQLYQGGGTAEPPEAPHQAGNPEQVSSTRQEALCVKQQAKMQLETLPQTCSSLGWHLQLWCLFSSPAELWWQVSFPHPCPMGSLQHRAQHPALQGPCPAELSSAHRPQIRLQASFGASENQRGTHRDGAAFF